MVIRGLSTFDTSFHIFFEPVNVFGINYINPTILHLQLIMSVFKHIHNVAIEFFRQCIMD